MKEHIKKLAEEAGFCLWTDEAWNPGDVVDWGSRYDDELEKFAELIRQTTIDECLEVCNNLHDKMTDSPLTGQMKSAVRYISTNLEKIKTHDNEE